jgi:hypothetical protein
MRLQVTVIAILAKALQPSAARVRDRRAFSVHGIVVLLRDVLADAMPGALAVIAGEAIARTSCRRIPLLCDFRAM